MTQGFGKWFEFLQQIKGAFKEMVHRPRWIIRNFAAEVLGAVNGRENEHVTELSAMNCQSHEQPAPVASRLTREQSRKY